MRMVPQKREAERFLKHGFIADKVEKPFFGYTVLESTIPHRCVGKQIDRLAFGDILADGGLKSGQRRGAKEMRPYCHTGRTVRYQKKYSEASEGEKNRDLHFAVSFSLFHNFASSM